MERNPNLKDGEKDMYVPPYERQNPKDSEGGRLKCVKCSKSAGWRATGPIGKSPKRVGLVYRLASQFHIIRYKSFVDMAKPKVAGGNRPPRTKGTRIITNVEVAASKGKATKRPTSGGKANKEKGKEARGVYASSCRKLITTIP
uniref:Uncharacterized protein n=1 Tax=Solanum tuberosum TaxID=4113 RepID=M1D956_SOLTU